jgi:hypothetical protein
MTGEAKYAAEAMEREAHAAAERVAGLLSDTTIREIVNEPNLAPIIRSAAAEVSKRRRAAAR